MTTSLKNLNFLVAKIPYLRENRPADIGLYTDASTTVGSGAWVADLSNKLLVERFIRWTPEEISLFAEKELGVFEICR